ncbi:MAG: hypothetical protein JW839_15105, partial [Candidatus Lokiarchaeota archaeon]|nr:hypothetical protein [Candidatus Lokiarchaeota archaeon]
ELTGDSNPDVLLDSGYLAQGGDCDRVYVIRLQGHEPLQPGHVLADIRTFGTPVLRDVYVSASAPLPSLLVDLESGADPFVLLEGSPDCPARYGFDLPAPSPSAANSLVELDLYTALEAGSPKRFLLKLLNRLGIAMFTVEFVLTGTTTVTQAPGLEFDHGRWVHASLLVKSASSVEISIDGASAFATAASPLLVSPVASIEFTSEGRVGIDNIATSWTGPAETASYRCAPGTPITSASPAWRLLDPHEASTGKIEVIEPETCMHGMVTVAEDFSSYTTGTQPGPSGGWTVSGSQLAGGNSQFLVTDIAGNKLGRLWDQDGSELLDARYTLPTPSPTEIGAGLGLSFKIDGGITGAFSFGLLRGDTGSLGFTWCDVYDYGGIFINDQATGITWSTGDAFAVAIELIQPTEVAWYIWRNGIAMPAVVRDTRDNFGVINDITTIPIGGLVFYGRVGDGISCKYSIDIDDIWIDWMGTGYSFDEYTEGTSIATFPWTVSGASKLAAFTAGAIDGNIVGHFTDADPTSSLSATYSLPSRVPRGGHVQVSVYPLSVTGGNWFQVAFKERAIGGKVFARLYFTDKKTITIPNYGPIASWTPGMLYSIRLTVIHHERYRLFINGVDYTPWCPFEVLEGNLVTQQVSAVEFSCNVASNLAEACIDDIYTNIIADENFDDRLDGDSITSGDGWYVWDPFPGIGHTLVAERVPSEDGRAALFINDGYEYNFEARYTFSTSRPAVAGDWAQVSVTPFEVVLDDGTASSPEFWAGLRIGTGDVAGWLHFTTQELPTGPWRRVEIVAGDYSGNGFFFLPAEKIIIRFVVIDATHFEIRIDQDSLNNAQANYDNFRVQNRQFQVCSGNFYSSGITGLQFFPEGSSPGAHVRIDDLYSSCHRKDYISRAQVGGARVASPVEVNGRQPLPLSAYERNLHVQYVSFDYSGNSGETWTNIATCTTGVQGLFTSTWDVTGVPEGNYLLRARSTAVYPDVSLSGDDVVIVHVDQGDPSATTTLPQVRGLETFIDLEDSTPQAPRYKVSQYAKYTITASDSGAGRVASVSVIMRDVATGAAIDSWTIPCRSTPGSPTPCYVSLEPFWAA